MTVRLGTKLIANTSSGGTGGTNVLVDNITITKDENDIITTVAIDNKNNSSNIPAVKTWMGTLAEYEAIENKSNDVIYYITDDETLAQSANVSLSNLSEEGEKHFLNKSQITNCLLEVPQKIKLELNDGVLTLKAGSKVIVPNGFEADETTPKFDEIVVTQDLSVGASSLSTAERGIVLINGSIVLVHWASNKSGTSPIAQGFYYHAGENKFYRDGVAQTNFSFPIMMGDYTSQYGFNNIKHVFNGMGYFGSTVWVYKGVKVLFPNGRNEDGTLNNIEGSTQIVKMYTAPSTYTNPSAQFVIDSSSGIRPNTVGVGCNGYIEVDEIPTSRISGNAWLLHRPSNLVYQWNATTSKYELKGSSLVAVVDVSITAGVITSFRPKFPLKAVHYNDLDTKVNKSGDTMTGILTGISSPYPFIVQSNVMDIAQTPTANQHIGYDFRDKNGTRVGWAGVVNNTSGTKYFQIQNIGGVDGFVFPRCTAKATTTSTASDRKVAVVVQNYVNGTSWYRVWSDGWIEQGGYYTHNNTATVITVTLLKSFSNTNYNLQKLNKSDSSAASSIAEYGYVAYETKNTGSFTCKMTASNRYAGFDWYACGY